MWHFIKTCNEKKLPKAAIENAVQVVSNPVQLKNMPDLALVWEVMDDGA